MRTIGALAGRFEFALRLRVALALNCCLAWTLIASKRYYSPISKWLVVPQHWQIRGFKPFPEELERSLLRP